MTKSACNLMKLAAVASAVLIIAGSLLVLFAQQLPLDSVMPAMVSALGFFSIVSGIFVLVATVLVVMLPSVSRRLDVCQH